MYLVLPLKSGNNMLEKTVETDWENIRTAVERWSRLKQKDFWEPLSESEPEIKTSKDFGPATESQGVLITSNGPMLEEDLIGKFVSVVHNSCRYYIQGVCEELTGESPFPDIEYESYTDYYRTKKKWHLRYPKQSMLLALQISKPRNTPLLNNSSGFEENEPKLPSAKQYVELPPELCLVILPGPYVRATELLPPVLHRVERLEGACELRNRIAEEIGDSRLSTVGGYKVMEALTSTDCMEEFSFERQHLLGASCIKYGVASHLFRGLPEESLEYLTTSGDLTTIRSYETSNKTLNHYALRRELQMYLQTTRFSLEKWLAPGLPPIPYNCTHFPQRKLLKTKVEGGFWAVEDEDEGRVSKNCFADSVGALIGVYWAELEEKMGPEGAFLVMEWFGIPVKNAYNSTKILDCKEREETSGFIRYEKLETALGYTFNDKTILLQAITHSSLFKKHLAKLEYLGDSFLNLVVLHHLSKKYPNLCVGQLTGLHSGVVNNENLSRIAVKTGLELHNYLLHDSDAMRENIRQFLTECKNRESEGDEALDHAYGSGDVRAPKVLGSLVEALVGAMLMDSSFNYQLVSERVRFLLEPFPNPETFRVHPRMELLELCQAKNWTLEFPSVKVQESFVIQALVEGEVKAVVEYSHLGAGKRIVANLALSLLKREEEIAKIVDVNGTKIATTVLLPSVQSE